MVGAFQVEDFELPLAAALPLLSPPLSSLPLSPPPLSPPLSSLDSSILVLGFLAAL